MPSFKFDRTRFHDTLHDFVDGQKRRLEEAVSSSSVHEAISATLDLQALFLILAGRFAPYKRNVENLRMRLQNKQRWQRLVEILEGTVGKNELEDLTMKGEHFAVLDLLPSMLLRDGEIQLPSCQEVRQAYLKKSKQYHMDKQYVPNRQQARISPALRGWMMPKVTEANEFLQSDANREGFGNRIKGLFLDKLQGRATVCSYSVGLIRFMVWSRGARIPDKYADSMVGKPQGVSWRSQ